MKPRLTERSERKSVAECDPTPSEMYYVYLLQDRRTRQLYYGYTRDLNRRLVEHEQHGSPELAYSQAS